MNSVSILRQNSFPLKQFKMKYFYIILILTAFACSQKKTERNTNESSITKKDYKSLRIPEYYDNKLQFDSIFDFIEAIPLETNNHCLISSVSKVTIYDSLVYIQNQKNNLYVFSNSGKFIREISNKGNGPGEFLEIRDFDVDNTGNIYILDFLKILEFSKEGKFLTKYKFENSPNDRIKCNPLQFALCGNDDFYIWGGSIGIKSNNNKNLFLLYKVNKKGEIKERYFPLLHKTVNNPNQFGKFSNHYNLTPWYGNSMIYKVANEEVSAKYYVDFGKYTMKEAVPEEFNDISKFKAEIDQKYANSIRNIVETKDWIYFMFSYKGYMKNVYYSKILNKAFVSVPFPRVQNRIMPWMIDTSDGENFFSLIEPRVLLKDLESIDPSKNEYLRWGKILKNLSINDNLVILKCKMKKY